MKPLCWLLCCGLVFTACRKKREAAPDAPTPPTPATASQPTTVTTSSEPAPGSPPVVERMDNRHFNQLCEALLKFRRDKQRAPKDWQELISTGYLKQMPTPPAGKHYTFDRSLNVQMVPAR